MSTQDIAHLSTAELGKLIKQKEVSPVEATETYLQRIDDLDFQYNSYLTVCREEALQAAREAEQAIAHGSYLGPMHGIPVAVKDQVWTKGIRSTGGSRFLMDFVPEEDSGVVANLKKAGAIILGKTNLTEFALGGFTHRFSNPRNPWNLEMSTGGSSSGSGAATRAYLCSTSLGEDTGGSIRMPSSWCGLVGLRPTWGRVSRYGVMTGVWSNDAVGPMSRTAEDAAITLGAIAGHDPKDPYSWSTPVPDYQAALDGNIRGMKVGVVEQMINDSNVEPEIREAVLKATTVLGELGATVEDVSIPLITDGIPASSTLLIMEPALMHRERVKERLNEFGPDTRISMLVGSIMPAHHYYKAQKIRTMLRRQILAALETYDVLIFPTTGKPAQKIQNSVPISSKEQAKARIPYLLTRNFNLASCPAASIPCGFTSSGLPIGMQIGSRPDGDGTVLKIAHAYEQAAPWHTMRPPAV